MSDSCQLRGRSILPRESQQRSNAVGFAKVYSVCTSNLASLRVIVCAKRNRVFSNRTIIIIGIIIVIVTTHYVNGFKRVANVSIKSYVSKIHLCLALVRTLGNCNFCIVFAEIKFIARFVYIRYRVISLKNHQTEFEIAVT